jgi:hypothetical protein
MSAQRTASLSGSEGKTGCEEGNHEGNEKKRPLRAHHTAARTQHRSSRVRRARRRTSCWRCSGTAPCVFRTPSCLSRPSSSPCAAPPPSRSRYTATGGSRAAELGCRRPRMPRRSCARACSPRSARGRHCRAAQPATRPARPELGTGPASRRDGWCTLRLAAWPRGHASRACCALPSRSS